MTTMTRPKRTLIGIDLFRQLARQGDRVFTTERARELAPLVGLKESYLVEALYHLDRNGWIVRLRRGLYALSSTTPGVSDAHEYEIAMSLVSPAAISHMTALHHHGLTEQIPRTIFVLTTTEATVPRVRKSGQDSRRDDYEVGGTTYKFVQVRPHLFFGAERIWVADARVWVTDLERTLLDGLSMPRHFGGVAEVLHGFDVAMERLDVERIADYACRMNTSTAKRLGRVLESHGIDDPVVDRLASLPVKGWRKLDSSGPKKGRYNRRWMLIENPLKES